MIHYQTYTEVEAEKLIDLWNRSFDSKFPMDAKLWHQNVDLCRRTFVDSTVVAVKDGHIIGAILGKNPHNISAIFVAPEHRRQGVATELLTRAEVAFTGELETTVIVGQDDRHFFPGVPEEASAAHTFFSARGFTGQGGFANDMIRSLHDWDPEQASDFAERLRLSHGISLQPCTSDLVPSLLDHVEANYSHRWLRDTRDRVSIEPNPGEIIVALENGSDVVGFCHTWSMKSLVIGPSIYWRSLIGPRYGGLGPIGVAVNRRKIGLGYALLNYSVSRVAETGAETMVIDWTDLVDFYAKAGFHVWKRYVSYKKSY